MTVKSYDFHRDSRLQSTNLTFESSGLGTDDLLKQLESDQILYYFVFTDGSTVHQAFWRASQEFVENGILTVQGFDKSGKFGRVRFPLINLRHWAEVGYGTKRQTIEEMQEKSMGSFHEYDNGGDLTPPHTINVYPSATLDKDSLEKAIRSEIDFNSAS